MSKEDPLFISFYPGGILYADRRQDEHNDYKHVAFLDYESLTLYYKTDPLDLKESIERHAAALQARRGQRLEVSSSGQFMEIGVMTTAQKYEEGCNSLLGFGTGALSIATSEIRGDGYVITIFRDRSVLGIGKDGRRKYTGKETCDHNAESIASEMRAKFREQQ